MATAALTGSLCHAQSQSAPATQKFIEQIAWKVDYIGADYGKSVDEKGTVLDEGEYQEQVSFADQAYTLAKQIPLPTQNAAFFFGMFEQLKSQISQKSSASNVTQTCQSIKKFLKTNLGLRISPPDKVSFLKAKSLFQEQCATCHGTDGRANTPAAQQFKPPPASFHDPETMATLSPELAYQTISLGVEGTQMPSFSTLSSQQRWDLAFYILSLRHESVKPMPAPVPPWLSSLATMTTLAESSDVALEKEITKATPSKETRNQAVAFLRRNAPEGIGGSESLFTPLRQILQQAQSAAVKQDKNQALYLLDQAYNQKFEPLEGSLKNKDRSLVSQTEQTFGIIRNLIEKTPENTAVIDQKFGLLSQLIDRAEAILDPPQPRMLECGYGKKPKGWIHYAAWTMGLTLREGVEMALLIAFLLAFARKSGRSDWANLIHIGWTSAIGVGVLTYFMTSWFLQSFSGSKRELIEAISTFLALGILLPMTHAILGNKEARHWLGFLGKKLSTVQQTDAQQKNSWAPKVMLLGVSFLAVYREMVELILFYTPIVQTNTPDAWQGFVLGLGVSLVLLLALVLFVRLTGKRLNPKPFMRVSSVILGVFCIALAGQGMHALQEAHVLAFLEHPMTLFGYPMPNIGWLGLFDRSWQGLVAQGVVLLILVVPVVARIRKKQPEINKIQTKTDK